MDLYKALRITTNGTAGAGLALATMVDIAEHPAALMVYGFGAAMLVCLALLAWYDRS